MASNTGCTSDGELAMTFRISAVAVCRSSASCVSWNCRTFWIAITAWLAKVDSRSISLAENGWGSRQVTAITPMTSLSASKGIATALRKPRARASSRMSGVTSGSAS